MGIHNAYMISLCGMLALNTDIECLYRKLIRDSCSELFYGIHIGYIYIEYLCGIPVRHTRAESLHGVPNME